MIPGQKAFEKADFIKGDRLETDEFANDIDEKFKNIIKVEKRDFKNLSNMNNFKTKKLISAHSDVHLEKNLASVFKSETENIDESAYTKLTLNKGKSHNSEQKQDNLVSNYVKLPEKKYQAFTNSSSSKTTLITKSKSMREASQVYGKEASKSPNVIKFYPSEQSSMNSPADKKANVDLSNSKSGSSQKKICPKPIEQLMIHHSDTAVKPIIGNKEIEKTQEPVYKPDYLTFTPWTSEEFEKKIETTEIQGFMSEIYSAIVSNTNLTEKVHALSYFETLINNSNVANTLINSAFLTLFVHIMGKSNKSHMIKMRICSIIGLLIRHATVIENEVAESGICSILCQTLDDSKENVRRKAIAALGEYLFYAATQLDDDQASKVWVISEEAINTLIKSMRPYEDEIVRFYACKAIENITAQSQTAGHSLATIPTCKALLDAFINGGKDSYVNTAAVALSHVVKLNPSLFNYVIDYIPLEDICTVLNDGHSRVQQAFITMVNVALLHKNELLLRAVNE